MSALVTSTERLQRLLALVPYVMSRKSVGLAETAAAFGVSERELVDDLNLLWCVELRAPDPYCPIDLSYEGGEIVVSQAESMGRPLRLAVDEASALLVALRMLAEVPGLEDRSALSRLIAKLEAAAGEAASASAKVAVQVDIPDEGAEGYAAQIRAALSAGRRLHLRYYVPGRDEATERDVDPMRLHIVEGRPYLEGWCLRAEGMRLFRLDRVLSLDVLDVPSAPPAEAQPVDVEPGPVPAVARRHAGGTRTVRGGSLGGGVLPVRVGNGPGGRAAAGGAAHSRHGLGAAAGAAARRGRPGHLAAVAGGRYPRGRHGRARELCRVIAGHTRFACGNRAPPRTACRLGPRNTSPALKRTDMIGDLFDSPWKILIVAVVLIVLFGSKKLPHAARSLGQSMRILKKEVSGLHEDESDRCPGPGRCARDPVPAGAADGRPGRGSRRPAEPDRRAAAADP